ERLDAGELGLYSSRDGGRLGLLRLALLAVLGRLEQDRDFKSRLVPAVEVETRRRLLRVAIDGELTVMAPPLRCRSRPRALRVLAPAPEPPTPPGRAAALRDMTLIAHVSDLHFGAHTPAVVDALRDDIASAGPTLLAVSGDLTQRARPDEFVAARRFLDAIPCPRVVVPGNHDIPLFDVFRRFLHPLDRYREHIGPDVDPFFATDGLAVLGLNTARSNTWKDGRISAEQVERIRAVFCPLPEATVKVLVTHHPFLPPPSDPS